MSLVIPESLPKSSVKALLDHLVEMEDPREAWRVAHPLREVPLLVVCGTVCDCDDYDAIAAWGKAHLAVLRRYRPFHHGVPSGRWLALLINRINPGLFAQVLTDWVQAPWPERPDLVAIDGKTSRLCSSRHGIGPASRKLSWPRGSADRNPLSRNTRRARGASTSWSSPNWQRRWTRHRSRCSSGSWQAASIVAEAAMTEPEPPAASL